MPRLRGTLLNLLLASASLATCLALLEAGARAWVGYWSSQPDAILTPFAEHHPSFGWAKPPGARGTLIRPEYRVRLEINSHGLRGPERPYAKPAGFRRVLLLGDSFTEGFTVEEHESVRARLEAGLAVAGCPSHEVLNGGTQGWGTDQEYLFYAEQGRRYEPDAVILLFYYNDLYGDGFEDVGKPRFEVSEPDDRLVLRDSPVPAPARPPRGNAFRIVPWRGSMALRLLGQRTLSSTPGVHAWLAELGLVEPARTPHGPRPAELNPFRVPPAPEVGPLWRVTRALLRQLDREVSADGGRFAVFYVPARFEVDDAAWRVTRRLYRLGPRWSRDAVFEELRESCGRLGIPLIDARGAFRRAEQDGARAYFPIDGHWTARGHAIAAGAIVDHLTRHGRSCPGNGPAGSARAEAGRR